MYSEEKEVTLFGFGLVTIVIVAVMGCSLLAFSWFWIFYPLQVQRETYAAHQSYGYTVTQQNNLIALMADWNKHQQEIDTVSKDGTDETNVIKDLASEQQADISTMKADVSLMDQTQVPDSVTQFLIGK